MAYTDYFDTVQKIYIGYYQRPADPSGLIYWAARLDATHGNLNEIIEAFANSAESQALYGTIDSSTISGVVTQIYQALFDRAPEAAGLAYYVNGFNAHTFTAATIMLNVLNGAQNEDYLSVENKVTAAELFTSTIDPGLDGHDFQATYAGNADAAAARAWLAPVSWNPITIPTQGQTTAFIQQGNPTAIPPIPPIADLGDPILGTFTTFTLTTGVDTVTGTSYDDVIRGVFGGATGNTYTAGDSINGDGGNNVLDLTAVGTTISPPVAVSNAQTINIVDPVGGTLNAVLFTGDPKISFNTTILGQTSTLQSASLASTVGFAGAGNLTVNYANTAGTSDNALLSLAGVGTSATVTSTLDVSNTNTIEKVTIATTGKNFVTLNAGTAAGTITVNGDGTNTLAIGSDKTLSTIDGSTSTGTNTFALGSTLSNGDVIKGGTGTDTATFTAAGALGTVTFTGVETVTGGFGATGASFNLGNSTGMNTLNITDATVAMSITNASVSTMNFGKATATADVEVDTIDSKNATSLTINSVNGTTYSTNIADIETGHSPDVDLTFNTGVGGELDITDGIYSTKSIGDVTANVQASGYFSANWISAGYGSKGDIGNITLNVAANGSGYIDSAAFSGSVGDVTITVHEDGYGEVYASGSAYSGTGTDNLGGGGNIGNVNVTASGTNASVYVGVSAGSGNVGDVTFLANGEGAIVSGYVSAYEWSGGAASGNGGQSGGIGNIDVQAIGDGSYASGYFEASGGVGDINFAVNGATASGYLEVMGYSGDAGTINYSTTGFEASGYASASAGGSVGDVTMSLNSPSGSGYYYVSAGGYSGGDTGTISFDVQGTLASGYAYVEAHSGVNADGIIGDVTFTVGNNVSAGYLDVSGPGGVGTASITVGNSLDNYAEYYAASSAGDIGAVTATVGHDTDFYVEVSASEASVGSITVSTGDDSNIYVSAFAYYDVGDIVVTTAGTGAYADVYADADSLSSVNLGGFAGTYNIDASSVTGATVLTGGAGGGSISGGLGADILTGGKGVDTIVGNAGSDTITGAAGADTLTGNAGKDTFVYTTLTDTGITLAKADTITDFTTADDSIKTGVAGTATNYVEAAAAADFATALAAANTAMDGTVKYYLSDTVADGGLLFVDATMDGTADALIKLTGITSANFASTNIIA